MITALLRVDSHQVNYYFADVLGQYGVDVSPGDFDSIVMKYDLKEDGRFHYAAFLKFFMTAMRGKDGSGITSRKKLQPLRVPVRLTFSFN